MKKYGKLIIVLLGIVIIVSLLILIYFKTTFINKDEVKDIVATNMNVNVSDLYFEEIDFDFDKSIYEVEVYYQNNDYEYKIDAKEGNIIYTDYRNVNTNNSDSSNNSSNNTTDGNSSSNSNNNATTSITLDDAKSIAFTDANVTESAIQLLKTEQDYDDGVIVYEIEFIYNNYKFEYKINATSGEIVHYERDSIYN